MSVRLAVCLRRRWARPRSVHLSQGVRLRHGMLRAEPDVRLLAEPGFTREACRNMRLFVAGSAPLLIETFNAFRERSGVCRDFTHLAITLCRCMNIPARYVTGYLGDIGVPLAAGPMDFSAWFEVLLGERWYTFDARHNCRRIGRIVMGRGRDAGAITRTNPCSPSSSAAWDSCPPERAR